MQLYYVPPKIYSHFLYEEDIGIKSWKMINLMDLAFLINSSVDQVVD